MCVDCSGLGSSSLNLNGLGRMASFAIYEDQENRGVRRHKKENVNVLQESKRSAFANLPIHAGNVNLPKAKQVKGGFGDENAFPKAKANVCAKKPATLKTITEPISSLLQPQKPAPKEAVAAATSKIPVKVVPPSISIPKKSEDVIPESSKFDQSMSEGESESPMRVDKPIDYVAERKKRQDAIFEMEEYKHEIYSHLRQLEVQRRPKAGYMRKQPDINYSMRSILVDWLVEVTEEYKMDPETLFLAVSYIDRFLSYMSVVKANLQLVGTAAMFIASKYEEIYPPELGEFVYLTDDTYTKAQVLKMENLILKVLSFDLSVPTPLWFVKKYCLETQANDKVKALAMYLCELTLLEGDPYLKFLPSEIACSAVSLARHTFGLGMWNEDLELITGYSLDEFKTCLMHLDETFCKAANYPQKAVYDKYKASKWHSVSLLTPSSLKSLSNESCLK
ncbi:hypothetical protein J437_LFUL003232 [Ladona fulva]|uniref:Cyclin A n=1 Tax=Ladona fulva TaxID=123851 RepID=A0A8K0NU05_LADFU|nr:hypothetical protein J437_LFUL003232 [Ladona fulva]